MVIKTLFAHLCLASWNMHGKCETFESRDNSEPSGNSGIPTVGIVGLAKGTMLISHFRFTPKLEFQLSKNFHKGQSGEIGINTEHFSE